MKNNYEIEINIIEKYSTHLRNQNNLLREIGTQRTIHGGGFRYEKDAKELISPINEIASDVIFRYEEIRNFNLESICLNYFEMVTQQINKLQQLMYSQLQNITELTGNQVDAGGKEISQDLYLDLLEKIEIRFDEYGEPMLPQLHGPTGAINKFNNMNFTPAQIKRREEIIIKKRAEWYDKKCNRKLSFID